MVKVVDFKVCKNKQNEKFVALVLQGDLMMIQSQETGRYYASAKRCTTPSTFSEEELESVLGKEIPGRIEKVACEPYEYTIEETSEVITLSHRWEYVPENEPATLRVAHKNAA